MSGELIPILCGSMGGRNEAIIVFAKNNGGEISSAMMSFESVSANFREIDGSYYFLVGSHDGKKAFMCIGFFLTITLCHLLWYPMTRRLQR